MSWLVVDEASLEGLAASGELGWLRLWLGDARVRIWPDVDWDALKGAILVVADPKQLVRVARAHGKALALDEAGGLRVVGAQSVALADPTRTGVCYTTPHGRVLLAPPGGFAYERTAWMQALRVHPERPWIGVHPQAEAGPEPGVVAADAREALPDDALIVSDRAEMPEEALIRAARERGLKLAFAESCTAGMAAARIARVPGASEVLDRGWVAYANEAKRALLKVPAAALEEHGAVSREVVLAMARAGAGRRRVCVAISGIAGPGGGSREKPVGTVWFAAALGQHAESVCVRFPGGRAEVRARASAYAVALALRCIMRS